MTRNAILVAAFLACFVISLDRLVQILIGCLDGHAAALRHGLARIRNQIE